MLGTRLCERAVLSPQGGRIRSADFLDVPRTVRQPAVAQMTRRMCASEGTRFHPCDDALPFGAMHWALQCCDAGHLCSSACAAPVHHSSGCPALTHGWNVRLIDPMMVAFLRRLFGARPGLESIARAYLMHAKTRRDRG